MRFKNFIKEDLELRNPLHFIMDPYRPFFVVSPKQFDKEITVRNKVAFHVTSPHNAIKIKNLGKKKTISVLTKIDDDYSLKEGIASGIGLVKLKGDLVAQFPKDIYSETDNSGRRWIPVSGSDLGVLLEKPLKEFSFKLFEKYLTGYARDYQKSLGMEPSETYKEFHSMYAGSFEFNEFRNWLSKNLPNSIKSKMIQDYYDFCSKMLRTGKVRDFFKTYGEKYHSGNEYNEILMNNVKIVKGWVLPNQLSSEKQYIDQSVENYKKAGLSDKDIIVLKNDELVRRNLITMINKEGGK